MNYFFEYIRLVGYLTVILSSLVSIAYGKYHRWMVVGDILLSVFTMTALVHVVMFNGDRTAINNVWVTPGVLIWATFHFANLLKGDGRY